MGATQGATQRPTSGRLPGRRGDIARQAPADPPRQWAEHPNPPRDAGRLACLQIGRALAPAIRSRPSGDCDRHRDRGLLLGADVSRSSDGASSRWGSPISDRMWPRRSSTRRSTCAAPRPFPADRPVSDLLLSQSVLAGVGNAYKCEVLFLEAGPPGRHRLAALDPDRLAGAGHAGLTGSCGPTSIPWSRRPGRSTTGDRRRPAWVYGRAGKPCLRCGSTIEQAHIGRSPS